MRGFARSVVLHSPTVRGDGVVDIVDDGRDRDDFAAGRLEPDVGDPISGIRSAS